ncbi:MAG: class II aldolase/adducin family protein [bacterium]
MPPLSAAFDEMIRIGRLLYSRQHVVAAEGNMSLALGGDLFLVTPSGVCKGELTAADLLVVDSEGTLQSSPAAHQAAAEAFPSNSGDDWTFPETKPTTRASSEWPLHREIYRQRPDIKAVCHAHSPWATAFAAAGQPLAGCLLPEIIATLGQVPLAQYATPGTSAVPESILDLIPTHDALLLANHGVVTLGATLTQAYHRLESVERLAQVTLLSRLAGGERRLTAEEAAAAQSLATGQTRGEAPVPCEPAVTSVVSAPELSAKSNGADKQFMDSLDQAALLEDLVLRLAREIVLEIDRH